MTNRLFEYSIYYKLNFIPFCLLFCFLYIFIHMTPSDNKNIGYLCVTTLFVLCISLFSREKIRIPAKILVCDDSILAKRIFIKDINIKYTEIVTLNRSGYGVVTLSGCYSDYFYLEIIGSNNNKIVIRRDIERFNELLAHIERRIGKRF